MRHGLLLKHRLGQNFLVNDAIIEKILALAALAPGEQVFEVGPGIGTLTTALLGAGACVTAVEADRTLEPVLAETCDSPRFTLVLGDALKAVPAGLPAGFVPTAFVSNLPYQIAATIIMQAFEQLPSLNRAIVMVQTEVADRIAAAPGSKAYGAISLGVQYYAEPKIARRVAPSSFMPQPGVASSVLLLEKRAEPKVNPKNPEHMFACIKAAFLQRRKTLPNALSGYAPLGISREKAAEALRRMGLDERLRGETLDLEGFAALSDRICEG